MVRHSYTVLCPNCRVKYRTTAQRIIKCKKCKKRFDPTTNLSKGAIESATGKEVVSIGLLDGEKMAKKVQFEKQQIEKEEEYECGNCKKVISKGVQYCPSCGVKLKW